MKSAPMLAVWMLALMFLMLAVSAEAAPKKPLREAHAELVCADCHAGQKQPKQPGAMSCAKCHDPAETAQRTAALGKKNPHVSPHWGTDVPCWVCHKEHATDQNACLLCHTW